MPNSRYQKYEKPVAPTDPNAEYMSARETAYILGTSVRTIRDALKTLGYEGVPGRKVRINRETRADIHHLRSGAPTARTIRRANTGRPRKAAAPKPARAAA